MVCSSCGNRSVGHHHETGVTERLRRSQGRDPLEAGFIVIVVIIIIRVFRRVPEALEVRKDLPQIDPVVPKEEDRAVDGGEAHLRLPLRGETDPHLVAGADFVAVKRRVDLQRIGGAHMEREIVGGNLARCRHLVHDELGVARHHRRYGEADVGR